MNIFLKDKIEDIDYTLYKNSETSQILITFGSHTAETPHLTKINKFVFYYTSFFKSWFE